MEELKITAFAHEIIYECLCSKAKQVDLSTCNLHATLREIHVIRNVRMQLKSIVYYALAVSLCDDHDQL